MSVQRIPLFNLDKWESGSRGEGFILVFDLVSQVFLHAVLLKHFLLPLRSEQDPRGDGDCHCVLRLRLQPQNEKQDQGECHSELMEGI